MIPILCSVNSIFANLYNVYVIPTYKKYNIDSICSFEINNLSDIQNPPYGFCTVSHKICRQEHIRYILNFLNSFESNKYIISLDSDIIFLPGFVNYINTLLDTKPNASLFISKDSDHGQIPNLGFMILKNCPEIINLLNDIVYIIGRCDIDCHSLYSNIGQYINKYHTNKYLLDTKLFIHNNLPIDIAYNRIQSPNACIFHATSSNNIYDKALTLARAMYHLENRGTSVGH